MHCPDCGFPMPIEHAEKFGRCFDCEKAWLARVRDWKAGRRADPELDAAKARGMNL